MTKTFLIRDPAAETKPLSAIPPESQLAGAEEIRET